MIEKITVKSVASFDFNGEEISPLKKINFIYGANGCGKTTISNLIAYPQEYSGCKVEWLHNQPLQTLVYNRRFRDKNFSGSNKLPGIFTLGQATKEEIENIEFKRIELKKIKDDVILQKETLIKEYKKKESEEESFKNDCWEYYKRHKIEFSDAFIGAKLTESFKNKLIEQCKNNIAPLLSLEDLREKARTIFGEQPQPIDLIQPIAFDEIEKVENDNIWSKKIIGKSDVDIATLIQKLNNNDWVNQGRSFLQVNDDTCPFCQQKTASITFKQKLEEYFDESFIKAIKELKGCQTMYETSVSEIINVLVLIETNKNKKLNLETFSAFLKSTISKYEATKVLISNKVKEPSRVINIVSLKEEIKAINDLISKANVEIAKHNAIVLNYNIEKTKLINAIWRYIVEVAKSRFTSFNTTISNLNKATEGIEKQLKEKEIKYNDLNNEIVELGKNITGIEPTIIEINRMLKSFGFHNFEIVETEEKGYYQILREDGTLAKFTLSEGERTFITFLYFLQLAKGATDKEDVSLDRVLVIDDPISSLDSNVLFIVSTLIKDIIYDIRNNIGNIKQLIILTHNVYFHKEVSFIDGKTKDRNDTHFWILRKKNKISLVQSYEKNNPIQSSYELLWQEIKEKEKSSGVTIQNTMRRIIENYFSLLGKNRDDILIKKFESKEEQDICRSLLCWINDGSHCILDDMFIEIQGDTIDKYTDVFRQIFEKTGNIGHYNMMMGIINN